jgi:hypothetical protein
LRRRLINELDLAETADGCYPPHDVDPKTVTP